MAKIQSVDYEAIPQRASNMREIGIQLNNELTTAYQSITDMHNVWYGKRYQSLVLDFNAMIPQLNEMLDLVVGEIPYVLETIANNYATVDTGSTIVGAQQTAPTKIADIAIATDVGMRFLTSEVNTIQNNVSTNFDNTKELMNNFETVLNQVEWESEAAESFRARFTSLKNSIVNSIDNIRSEFVKLMQQAQDDIQNAETANTVQ